LRVVLLGPPGAGKGTQAATISKRLAVPHIATGDLFRQAQNSGTPVGLLAKSYMEKGMLVPDEVTIQMVQERLSNADCRQGFLLDGFPRNVAQAQALDKMLSSKSNGLSKALNIKVSTEELVRRLSGRWICRNCQTPYHAVNAPPKSPGVCDKCGGPLYQRPDDREDTVRQRVRVYLEETAPLVDYYQKKKILVEVNGEESIEAVQQQLLEALS